jgi:Xaa-Pro dipeptidase
MIFMQPRDYWYKPPGVPHEFWTAHFEIAVIHDTAQAGEQINGIGRCAFIGEWQEEFSAWNFAARNPKSLVDRLHFSRAIKTAYEIECMRQASRLAARGHAAAEAAFRQGASEYDIHTGYLRAIRQTENELPYPSIVALNSNAAVLHYQHQERAAPAQIHSFLIDAGADHSGYASDITRTYAAAKDDFAALVDGMHELQQSLCGQVRAGTDYASIHLDAHLRIAALLRDSELIRVPAEDAVGSGLSGVFFPHGVGHLLGLQVHDVAGFMVDAAGTHKQRPTGHPNLRLTRTLEPGFVVTIEPGLYFIDALLDEARTSSQADAIQWRHVDALRRYGGIRIEDNVVCTSGEPENLTRPAFAQAHDSG